MMNSVALPTIIHRQAVHHLIREDGQEDLCFALWYPSRGQQRKTALIHQLILPKHGERQVHGNASFLPHYFERALGVAVASGGGLAFIHSHPGPGWQDMSWDDVNAERGHAAAAKGATGYPLVGLTLGTDQAWSGRFWEKTAPRIYEREWCTSVRVVGEQLAITLHPTLTTTPSFGPQLERTRTAWGNAVQTQLTHLRVGVVGAGSVGCIVAEALARMGVGHITLLDFDTVEMVNLDRLLFATRRDAQLRRAKVEVLANALINSGTARDFSVDALEWSVIEEAGFRAALDCDVLFSCVDRPWPRSVLNFIAYAHLIPVVDGGVRVAPNPKTDKLRHADWRAHIAIPTRPCLSCLEQYTEADAAAERDGYFDDPSYFAGLPDEHQIKRNENVFAFGLSTASFEVLQFLAMMIAPSGLANPGAQRYHFVTGKLEIDKLDQCKPGCFVNSLVATGDCAPVKVTGKHKVAEQARKQRQQFQRTWRYKLRKWLPWWK